MRGWWLRLVRYARPELRGLCFLVLTILVAALLDTLTPWPIKLLADNAIAGEPLPAAAAWIGALPGAASPEGLVVWLAAGSVVVIPSLTESPMEISRPRARAMLGCCGATRW